MTSVTTSLLDPLWLGGVGVCPSLAAKGRRGRVIAAYSLPVSREDISGDFLFGGICMTDLIILIVFVGVVPAAVGVFCLYQTYLWWKNTAYPWWKSSKESKLTFFSYALTAFLVLLFYVPAILIIGTSLDYFFGGERCDGFCKDIAKVIAFAIFLAPFLIVSITQPRIRLWLQAKAPSITKNEGA